MIKYLAIATLFLFSNEILTLLALLIMAFIFIADILKARLNA